MERYGLIGRSLTHSFSKKYFTAKFAEKGLKDHRYDLFELAAIDEFPGLMRDATGLRGLNVTIPYKEAVIPYLDALDPLAAAVGAVNAIGRFAVTTRPWSYSGTPKSGPVTPPTTGWSVSTKPARTPALVVVPSVGS